MKARLIVIVAIAATIGSAIPAHADPETDTTFLDAIGDEGINVPNPIGQAHGVCSTVRDHPDQTFADVAAGFAGNNPGISDAAAAFFAGAAIGAYCPQYKPLVTAS